ncbi:MAG: hypothetical protein ACPL1B_09925 [Thermoprotei archaeon]
MVNMPISTEYTILIFIMFFLSFLAIMSNLSPYKIADTFDFAWFGGSAIAIAVACSLNIPVLGGIACAGATTIFAFGTFTKYILLTSDYIKLIVFLPLVAILMYIIARLIRGGG